jgi:two-component system, LytTR family, response regulator LytT
MINNFKILIVDDEVLIAEFLKDELLSLGYYYIELAHHKQQVLLKIEEFQPQLVLLDIRMKTEREGIEIAEEINRSHNIPFIFITAHSDTEILKQALETKPVGYITKPFKQIDVYAAVRLVEVNFEKVEEKCIVFKEGHANVKLFVDEILYVQSNDNYIHIFIKAKKYTVRNTLEWFKENTPDELFHRTHRSFIVNITKITKSTSKSVFINDIEIPVSRGNQLKM